MQAFNGYIPDPTGGSGWYQRPAFLLGATSSLGTAQAAGQWHYTSSSGTEYNFAATSGKLFRINAAGNATDVTPVGTAIDSGATTRVFFQQLGDILIVTDMVHRPWIGTNLGATPITGAYIDIDGASGAWTAYGAPTIYQGSCFFITATTPGGSGLTARLALVWCEPNQPTVGYIQSGFADFWNLIQISERPITGILGIETGLIVWRDQGIGMLAGTPSVNFASTATTQAISDSIGLLASATIARYVNNVFFCDQFGRPQLIQGTTLVDPPLWLQLRAIVEQSLAGAGGAPAAIAHYATGVIEPNLNLYLCAPWSSGSAPSTLMLVFDAASGTFVGEWTVSASCGITGFGIQRDTNNTAQLWVTGEHTAGGGGNVLWQLQRLGGSAWTDANAAQTVSVATGRMGYAADQVWDAGSRGTVVTMGPHAVQVTVVTPYTSATVQGTATPNTSQDGTYRCVVGMDVHAARGIQVQIVPTLGATQWGIQRWEMAAVPSTAGPEDA